MRRKQILVCGILAVMIALAFTACNNDIEPGHVHDSGEWHITLAATCTETGTWTENQPADGIEKQVCSLIRIAHRKNPHRNGIRTGRRFPAG
jgi:hypothetical protein